MKMRVALVVLGITALLRLSLCAEDLSQYKTAADLWSHIEALKQGPEEGLRNEQDLLDFALNLYQAAEAYDKNYSAGSHRWDAKLIMAETAGVLAELGQPGFTSGKAAALARDVAQAKDAPKDTRAGAAFLALRLSLDEDPKVFAKAIADYQKNYPADPRVDQVRLAYAEQIMETHPPEAVALLKELSENKDEAVAERAMALAANAALLGKPLDLKFTAVNGEEVDLSKMKGKVVLLDFWATWCGPCMMEVPKLVEAYQKYHSKGLEVVGISLDQDKDAMLQVTAAKGMTWPQYFDGQGWQNDISSRFGINTIPRMWLIDRSGNLVSVDAGPNWESRVEKLMGSGGDSGSKKSESDAQ